MATTTMEELFADDSSDEESIGGGNSDKPRQDDATDEKEASPAEKETSNGMDTQEEQVTSTEEENAVESVRKPRQIEEEDDDNEEAEKANQDEDDVEFNDADADIVGTSAPAVPKTASLPSPNKVDPSTSNEPIMMHVVDNERPPEGATFHMTKLPAMLVGIQPDAFDEDAYSAAMEEQEYNNVLHMIRWRYKRNSLGELERDDYNKLVRESNTRIVHWDDGSYTLHVGSEVFEVDSLKTATSAGFAGINGYLYQSQQATYSSTNDTDERTSGGTVLECMGPITSKLTARPSSLQSDAHRNLTVSVRQRNMKKARIAEYVTEHDPEKAKAERIKMKEELEKASARKNKASSYPGTNRRTPGMNRRYLEEEEDDGQYDSVNIGALKRRGREQETFDYGDDSDDDLEDDWAAQKLSDRKRKRQSQAAATQEVEDDQDDIILRDDSSDDEDEVIHRAKVASATKKRSNQAVLEDEDDE